MGFLVLITEQLIHHYDDELIISSGLANKLGLSKDAHNTELHIGALVAIAE